MKNPSAGIWYGAGAQRLIHRYFKEKQVYRIDHYLGRKRCRTCGLRLGNGLIESAWNRERIESVQITVAETLGVGTRAGYYDTAGALRDMVQNHLAQLLSLVAMEVPGSFDADAIRFEKIKALRAIEPIRPERVVRGQYTAGTIAGRRVRGYLEEDGVLSRRKPKPSWPSRCSSIRGGGRAFRSTCAPASACPSE